MQYPLRRNAIVRLLACVLVITAWFSFPRFRPASVLAQPIFPPAPPVLNLPTPPGAPWRIIQGYGCGTHDEWDFFAIDLVAERGVTLGAPVYAAAAGTVRAWVEPSGTLILDHGDGFLTQYTHMDPLGTPQRGAVIARGAQIGTVGERGTSGNPHLHFMLYREIEPERAEADAATVPAERQRVSLPLRFVEGYDLPLIAVDACSQHQGVVLVGAEKPAAGHSDLRRTRLPSVDGVLICPVREGWCMG